MKNKSFRIFLNYPTKMASQKANEAITQVIIDTQTAVYSFAKNYVNDQEAFLEAFKEHFKITIPEIVTPTQSVKKERRTRKPSQYNKFIEEEIVKLKKALPDIKDGREYLKLANAAWKGKSKENIWTNPIYEQNLE